MRTAEDVVAAVKAALDQLNAGLREGLARGFFVGVKVERVHSTTAPQDVIDVTLTRPL